MLQAECSSQGVPFSDVCHGLMVASANTTKKSKKKKSPYKVSLNDMQTINVVKPQIAEKKPMIQIVKMITKKFRNSMIHFLVAPMHSYCADESIWPRCVNIAPMLRYRSDASIPR